MHEGRLQVLAPTTTAASATTRASSPRRCSARTRRARALESDIVEADDAVQELRRAQPATSRSPRCASATASGRTCETSPQPRCSACPPCPGILGFDPRYQFIHEDDIVGALHHAVANDAARASTTPRRTACSRCREVASLLGKPFAPLLPPWGTGAGDRADRPARAPHPRRGPPAAALRPRAGQPQAQAVGLPLQPHDARNGAGVCGGSAPETAARERRGAISLRARSGGIPPLVAECAARRVSRADAPAALQDFPLRRSASYHLPDPMRTRLIVLAAFVALLGVGGVAGAYFYDQSKQDLIAEGVKVNGVPIGGHDARRRRRRSSPPTLLAPLDRPVKVRYKDRTFTLTQKAAAIGIDIRGSVDKALKRSQEGDMFSRTLAQPAQRVAQHRAGGRRHATTSRRSTSSSSGCASRSSASPWTRRSTSARAQVDRRTVQDRPAREVQHAGQGGREDAARPRQHRRRSRSRPPSCSPRSRPSSWPRSTRRC